MASSPQLNNVPACFFFASHINKNTSGYLVCKEIEKVVGVGNVVGAQFLHGLYRVYLKSMDARKTLLLKGVTINGVYIACIDQNPNLVKGAEEKPALKIIIGHLPLSVSNEEILTHLKRVEGVNLRTGLFDEKYRDDNGGLTSFKTGRRFAYSDPPEFPLPREFLVGDWKASLWHFGQKTNTNQNNTDKSQVSPQGVSSNSQTIPDASNTERLVTDTAKQCVASDTSGDSARGRTQDKSEEHGKSNSTDAKSKFFSFFNNNSDSRTGRSTERGRRHSKNRSVSKSRHSDSRKRFGSEHSESPSGKTRSRFTGQQTAGNPQSVFDYFDFTNDTSEEPLSLKE